MQPTGTVEVNEDMFGCLYECSAGLYGDADNLTTFSCSGPCWTGYYCPGGTAAPLPW